MKYKYIIATLAAAFLLSGPAAHADSYSKLFEKEKKFSSGLLPLHLTSDGKVYAEVPDSLLGRDFVLGTTIKSASDNAVGLVGSKDFDLLHFTFAKVDSTIQVRRLEPGVVTSDPNIRQALCKNKTGAVMGNYKSKAVSPSGCLVVDLTDFFLSDADYLLPFVPNSLYSINKDNRSFKKDLSFVEDVKCFEDNFSVQTSVSYEFTVKNLDGKTIVDKQPFTAQTLVSVLLLPKEPYHPRMADPRIGYFFTEMTRLENEAGSEKPMYLANRWRLEPSDTAAYKAGIAVEPVKPIVFYIDPDFPDWWKPYIENAVRNWNIPFERIGFKNAVKALPFPEDDPEFDPDNIKYSCIRYAPVGIRNAMGPSWTDPRSGEIINASVYVYHDILKLLYNWMFVQTSAVDPAIRSAEIPTELLGDALEYVIRHEVGHTLGLMHNMGASNVIPTESLRDPDFTSENGTTTSIMDYSRFNYVAQPGDLERGVRLTPPLFGKYDYWAIRWGYTPVFDAPDFAAEAEITKGWITDSLKVAPWYRYGKQQMSSVYFDPRYQAEDLGDDVIASSRYGVANLKRVAAGFMNWIDDESDPDYRLRIDIYENILNQYLRYFGHVVGNIGGLYKNEVLAGDPTPPFENVPGDLQRNALKYAIELYNDVEWLQEASVTEHLPLIGKPASVLRRAMSSTLFYVPFLADRADGVNSREFSYREAEAAIEDFVWGKKGTLSPDDRALQRDFVAFYMSLAGFKDPAGSAKSIAAQPQESCCTSSELRIGTLSYDPISGFEWSPRALMSNGELSASTVYGILRSSRDLCRRRARNASGIDKAHYEMLVTKIGSALGLE